jgi:S-adenosylmethionine hydrolase
VIFLFTDFGSDGPYLGQVDAVLTRLASTVPVIHLFNDVPAFDPRGAAYLLSAYTSGAVAGDVVLAVVDPGVGTARRAIAVCADGIWYVGPDNGVLAIVAKRAKAVEMFDIGWKPERLSNSFHGRDLFAPAAARFATLGRYAFTALGLTPVDKIEGADWPAEHEAIVYFDRYGNAVTGCRAGAFGPDARFEIAGQRIAYAATFGAVPAGEAFWYENSNGLVEIAVNQGSARDVLGVALGIAIRPVSGG